MRKIQLAIEYDPVVPFRRGTPLTSSPEIVKAALDGSRQRIMCGQDPLDGLCVAREHTRHFAETEAERTQFCNLSSTTHLGGASQTHRADHATDIGDRRQRPWQPGQRRSSP